MFCHQNRLYFTGNNEALTYSGDNVLRLWDIVNCRRIELLTGHTDKVVGIVSSDQQIVISASLDKSLRIWDVMQRMCIATYKVTCF